MSDGLIWTILVISILGTLIGTYGLMTQPAAPVVPTANEIADLVAGKIQIPTAEPVNTSAITDQLNKIEAEVNKEDTWKTQAEVLATSEYSKQDNKEIFNFIDDEEGNIVDREDITSITIQDTTFSGIDADRQNAVVTQDLKVKYENDDGDNAKVYLTITTDIEKGEITDQTIDFTD